MKYEQIELLYPNTNICYKGLGRILLVAEIISQGPSRGQQPESLREDAGNSYWQPLW